MVIHTVLAPLPNSRPSASVGNRRDQLITSYFRQGFSSKDIMLCLAASHGIALSYRTLKRILHRLGLKRRAPCTEALVTRAALEIRKELKESGQMIGYKAMWNRLKLKGLVVARDTVREIMLHLDGKGVRERARRRLKRRQYINPGPNFVWHVDGYDKLKPYGFAIHGAIDGFSRRIMWIEIGTTNNNPRVIVKYFLNTVLEMKTLPCIVRSDHGTENVLMKDTQTHLRSKFNDEFSGESSFMQGRSSSNQRIEAWWGILRKQCVGYWMNHFKDMVAIGMLDTSDPMHMNALRFCFLDLIEADIKRTALEWNRHLIETKVASDTPRGKPDVMYFHPVLYDTESYGFDCPEAEVVTLLHELDRLDAIPDIHDPDFTRLVNLLVPEWDIPNDTDSAMKLYARILDAAFRVC